MFEHEWCCISQITIEDVNVFVWLTDSNTEQFACNKRI